MHTKRVYFPSLIMSVSIGDNLYNNNYNNGINIDNIFIQNNKNTFRKIYELLHIGYYKKLNCMGMSQLDSCNNGLLMIII